MKLYAYINGKKITTEKQLSINNPSTNELLGSVPACTPKHIETAFEAANKAFQTFSKSTISEREKILNRMSKVLLDNKAILATILAKEVAKAYKDALIEIERSAEYIKQTIIEYKQILKNPRTYSETELKVPGLKAEYKMEPLGVILAISPFNYPINLLVSKLAPALITANTVVVKSPTAGSLVTSKFIELLHKENIQPGIINLVTGAGREIGDYIVTNKYIKLISFTGSTQVAKRIAKEQTMIPMILENGGKDPAIIFDDVDIKKVAKEIVAGAFSYSGQRCTAIKRVIVHEKIADEMICQINACVDALVVGDPFKEKVNITPLINKSSLDFNLKLLEDAKLKKAKLHQTVRFEKNLLWPVVVSKVKTNMLIWSEEPFGPILPIITFKNEDEAIKLANDSAYGLQASIFTKKIKKAEQLAELIEAGTVNINKSSSRGPDILPFFGIKDSGFGMQGIRESILSCTKLKGIVTKCS